MSELSTPVAAPQAPTSEENWLTIAERGSVLGIRVLFFLCTVFGRTAGRIALKPVVFYYVLFHGLGRRASRKYLEKLYPKVTFGLIYRHFLNFAEVTLDRVFLLKGDLHRFELHSRKGFEHIQGLRERKQGALLLGAHIGSVEALRVRADAQDAPINILAYTGNARMINALLKQLNPNLTARIVEIKPGSVDAMFKVKELIDAGELVALLGDRTGINEKSVTVDFLGAPAKFPAGVYLLASMLRCPVYMTFSLYTAPNQYESFCEPLVEDRIELPRGNREAALQEYAQKFASRLEHYCRQSPLNWFNFYDFWK